VFICPSASLREGKRKKVEKVVPQPMQWHRRLGHPNKADILRLARDPNSGISIIAYLFAKHVLKQSKYTDILLGIVEFRTPLICRYSCLLLYFSTCPTLTPCASKTPSARSTRPLEQIHTYIAGGGKTLDLEDLNTNNVEDSKFITFR